MNKDLEYTSKRFVHLRPSERRDKACHRLFNDPNAMLPHLPMLYNLSEEDFLIRRQSQRANYGKSSLFLDICIEGREDEILATAGFRAFEPGGTAEWGVCVTPSWRRKGVCEELFNSNMDFLAKSDYGCTRIKAVTMEDNIVMVKFLEGKGLRRTGEVNGSWIVFEANLNEIKEK